MVRDGVPVHLERRAWDLLCYLVDRPGEILAKEELFETVWRDVTVGDAALARAIKLVRRALGDEARRPRYIETVHRRGIRFIAKIEPWVPGLGEFARQEPLAFQFVEMQHHAPYLDNESRELERKVMLPLAEWIGDQGKGAVPVDPEHLIAMFWGAFVGLVKAERLGHLTLDEDSIRQAGKRLWRGMRMPSQDA